MYEAFGCAWQTVCAAEEFVLTGVLGTLLEEGVCTSYGLESEVDSGAGEHSKQMGA